VPSFQLNVQVLHFLQAGVAKAKQATATTRRTFFMMGVVGFEVLNYTTAGDGIVAPKFRETARVLDRATRTPALWRMRTFAVCASR